MLLFSQPISGCKEYRKVDSVLLSVEEEERYEFTGGHFLEKLLGFKTCIAINNSNKLEEKNQYFITEFIDVWQQFFLELLFCHCDG